MTKDRRNSHVHIFRPIKSCVLSPELVEGSKGRQDITRHCLIALAGAVIITLVILVIALAAKACFLSDQDEAVKKRRWVAESALREGNAPMGIYERVPGGWRNVESGLVYKDGK